MDFDTFARQYVTANGLVQAHRYDPNQPRDFKGRWADIPGGVPKAPKRTGEQDYRDRVGEELSGRGFTVKANPPERDPYDGGQVMSGRIYDSKGNPAGRFYAEFHAGQSYGAGDNQSEDYGSGSYIMEADDPAIEQKFREKFESYLYGNHLVEQVGDDEDLMFPAPRATEADEQELRAIQDASRKKLDGFYGGLGVDSDGPKPQGDSLSWDGSFKHPDDAGDSGTWQMTMEPDEYGQQVATYEFNPANMADAGDMDNGFTEQFGHALVEEAKRQGATKVVDGWSGECRFGCKYEDSASPFPRDDPDDTPPF